MVPIDADNLHAGGKSGLHAGGGIFDHETVGGRDLQLLRGHQVAVGRGLAAGVVFRSKYECRFVCDSAELCGGRDVVMGRAGDDGAGREFRRFLVERDGGVDEGD